MKHREERQRFWSGLIARFEGSGRSRKEFAAEAGVGLAIFQYWLYKFRRVRQTVATRKTRVAEVRIVPVTVKARPTVPARLELRVAGMRLRVPVGADPEYVARLASRNLTVHFKRVTYLIDPGPETLPRGGKRVQVREWADGRVEIQWAGRTLPFSVFDQNPHVAAGAIVENKRLGAMLAVIQAAQDGRDQVRLASKKLTIRQKDRIRAAGEASRTPIPSSGAGTGAVAAFLEQFEKDQKERTKAQKSPRGQAS